MRKVFSKFRDVSFALQVVLVATTLLLAIVLVGGEKIKEYERNYLAEETKNQIERLFEVFVASNIDPIISEDISLLETAVEFVTAINPEISSINIFNEDGKSLIEWRSSSSFSNENKIEYKKRVSYEGEHFGNVRIVRSMLSSQQGIEKHISNIYKISVLLLALLMVLLAITAYLMISRPINIINSRISAYLDGEEDKTTHRFYSKEFNLLNSSVDKLREITSGRDQLRDEMEVRIHIQFELEKARLAAEKANHAKTDFLSFMTHEIRTPLTAIIGFSENLLDYNQSMEERLDAIHTVINSSNHLLQLINDVLDISKIEAGHLDTESIKVELVVLLKEVVSIVRALVKNKDISFMVEGDCEVPVTITTDPLRLKQILINVISNAIKFTREGTVTLVVDYFSDENKLNFSVIDTGVGMTADQKENLFNAYGQADMSTAREYGGTGLGLFLSKSLAQKLGGGIHVDSAKGIGTNFTISVSAGECGDLIALNESDLNRAGYSSVEKLDIKLSGRVLLADDVLENQKLISHYITGMGAEVDIAANGLEAVEKAMSKDYDLVLMDIRMPLLDGFGAVRELRDKGYKVPIVSLSANNMSDDISKYMEAGFNAAAAKPIVRTEFKKLLSEYLSTATDEGDEQGIVYSSLLASEPEFLEIINMFLERLPELIEQISTSFETGDWQLLKEELHRTKGVAGNYGYSDLMKLVAKGEFVATSKDRESFTSIMEEIKDMERRILMAVEK